MGIKLNLVYIYIQGTQHVELMPVNLQCDGSDSLGLTLKFDDSEQLIVEEIKSDGIADKVQCQSSACIIHTKSFYLFNAVLLKVWPF